ncbi:MAG TPA: CofH family radical SAM protein [Candidatus Obscuribacterales bacterium]
MQFVIEQIIKQKNSLSAIASKVVEGARLTREDAIELYKSADVLAVGALAEYARRMKAGKDKERYVYYIHNMHLNPTNVCGETCRFCSYANPAEKGKAYIWTVDRVLAEAAKGAALGISEIHMVGGLTPACDLTYYETVLRGIKSEFPHIHMKALTAVEIEYLSKREGISYKETLRRLIDAGLGSMPGGGAEMFSDTVREKMLVKKTPPETWLEIHGIAHELGLKSNATMLTGIGEGIEDKVEHLLMLRTQQDKSQGFQCFIPLKCYYEGTTIKGEVDEPTGYDMLKDVAVSRLVLDNFDHIKAYWIQLGEKVAQVALSFGADDMDGTIGEEKITHAAGAQTPLQLAKEEMERLISAAGYIPVERDTVYNIRHVSDVAADQDSVALSRQLTELAAAI